MSEAFEDSPRIFSEDAVRHLLTREVQRCIRYQDFLTLCLVRPLGRAGSSDASAQVAVAREIAAMLRSTDIVGLLAEDILVLLVHTPSTDAALIGERIRERIEGATLATSAGVRITLAIALACFPTDSTAEDVLLARAQAQLEAPPRTKL